MYPALSLIEVPENIAVAIDLAAIDLRSTQSLYESTVNMRRAGDVSWICLSGLCVDSKNHKGFCSTVAKITDLSDAGSTMPSLVVLDWSSVRVCSAEGIAFFLILVRWLSERTAVIVCSPTHAGVVNALEQSGARTCCGGGVCWMPSEHSGAITLESIANAVVFARSDDAGIGTFLDELSASLIRLGSTKQLRQMVMGLAQEVVQNVRSYAEANYVAATAFYFGRRRCLQIGISDDGIGVADSVLRQDRHAGLAWFSDAGVMSLVLRRRLSGRDVASDGSVSGGGMSQLISLVLEDLPSSILLRSGRALIELHSNSPKYPTPRRLNFARGTQFRLEVAFQTK